MSTRPELAEHVSADRHPPFDSGTRWVFASSALVVLLDQVTKVLIRSGISHGDERALIPGVLHFTHVYNPGAAFSLFPSSTWFLVLVSLAVCLAIVFGRAWWVGRGFALRAAIALELGGALGNLIDRLAFGHVTDFIVFVPELAYIGRWPAFNVADAALTCGAVLMGGALLLETTRSAGHGADRKTGPQS